MLLGLKPLLFQEPWLNKPKALSPKSEFNPFTTSMIKAVSYNVTSQSLYSHSQKTPHLNVMTPMLQETTRLVSIFENPTLWSCGCKNPGMHESSIFLKSQVLQPRDFKISKTLAPETSHFLDPLFPGGAAGMSFRKLRKASQVLSEDAASRPQSRVFRTRRTRAAPSAPSRGSRLLSTSSPLSSDRMCL